MNASPEAGGRSSEVAIDTPPKKVKPDALAEWMSARNSADGFGGYSAADRVMLKAEALTIWLEAVLPAYKAAKRDPRLLLAVEARKRSLSAAVRVASGAANRAALRSSELLPQKL